MANSFNLNTFLQEYKTYGDRKYTSFEVGEAEMEKREIAKAQEAINGNTFLHLTLGEKFAELGIGDRVMNKLGEIAMKPITDILDSVDEYFKKYEIVFNGTINDAVQSDAKQMFFSRQALAQDIEERVDFGKEFNMFM